MVVVVGGSTEGSGGGGGCNRRASKQKLDPSGWGVPRNKWMFATEFRLCLLLECQNFCSSAPTDENNEMYTEKQW
jgi:hypothetical protein